MSNAPRERIRLTLEVQFGRKLSEPGRSQLSVLLNGKADLRGDDVTLDIERHPDAASVVLRHLPDTTSAIAW